MELFNEFLVALSDRTISFIVGTSIPVLFFMALKAAMYYYDGGFDLLMNKYMSKTPEFEDNDC